MRLARTAALFLCVLLSGCKLIPVKGATHAVYDPVAPAYPNCLADTSPRFSYRKRVLFTRLDVKSRAQLRGLYGIESRFMESLVARIDRNKYHPISQSEQLIDSVISIDLHGKVMPKSKKVVNLARQHRAQFVVSGEILDMGQQQQRSLFSRTYRSNPLLGAYTNDPERMIVIRLDVYEGSSGVLLDQQTFKAWSKDGADLNTQYTLMGERFMHTALGAALHGVLTQQQEYVSGLLSCIPLQAEIMRMAGLERAVLSVGAVQGVRPGDSFKAYRNSQPSGVHEQMVSQRSVGKLVIEEVYPEHAIGSLEAESGATLRQGDWVRAW